MKKGIFFILFSFLFLNTALAQNTDFDSLFINGQRPSANISNSMFDDFLTNSFFSFANHFPRFSFSSVPLLSSSNIYFPLDLEETDQALIATVELGAINPKAIELDIQNESRLILVKRDESSQEKEEEKENRKFYYQERSVGSFARQVQLPAFVDESETTAVVKDGILTITMPKKEKSKEPKIQIIIEE